ncbi:hypothetical protein MXB_5350 [Myxobolus squamalis]|nr:hypothetical protein MXB_5350 [Myxobolus squamalis]
MCSENDGRGGFLPAVKQIANVASLPGIIGVSEIYTKKVLHRLARYSLRLVNSLPRTNLTYKDIEPVKEQLVQKIYDHIPVGMGCKGMIPVNNKGYSWAEDKEHCEEYGRMLTADHRLVSEKAKKRGLLQLGTLGSGNHYAEIQIVDEIYDEKAASQMGLDRLGQVCIMIHSGSRGLGHQVATDALRNMKDAMNRDNIEINDPQAPESYKDVTDVVNTDVY